MSAEIPYMCPVCKDALTVNPKELFCAHNHHFDRGLAGSVNLLLANEKKSNDPGDSVEMIQARQQFLDKGHYQTLADAVTALGTSNVGVIADIGCGDGYYAQYISEHLADSQLVGVDISKSAIKYAARRKTAIPFIIAPIKSLPFLNGSIATIVNIFAPRDFREFDRVLADKGQVIIVSPGPDHLKELRLALSLSEKPHAEPSFDLGTTSLTQTDRQRLTSTIHLTSKEDIRNLCAMTPFWWKIGQEARTTAAAIPELSITTDFVVTVFTKAT